MSANGAFAAMCACACLMMGIVFAVTKQDEIRKENNAFARDCNSRGGMVRLEYQLRQCIGAREK